MAVVLKAPKLTPDSLPTGLQDGLKADLTQVYKMPRMGHGTRGRQLIGNDCLHHRRQSSLSLIADVVLEQIELTPRQAEVLHWIAEGRTNNEIASILGCSAETVKNHVKRLFQRLGVHSRTAAAAYAYRLIIAEAERLRSAASPPAPPKARHQRKSAR